jgi:hypothetical protein
MSDFYDPDDYDPEAEMQASYTSVAADAAVQAAAYTAQHMQANNAPLIEAQQNLAIGVVRSELINRYGEENYARYFPRVAEILEQNPQLIEGDVSLNPGRLGAAIGTAFNAAITELGDPTDPEEAKLDTAARKRWDEIANVDKAKREMRDVLGGF